MKKLIVFILLLTGSLAFGQTHGDVTLSQYADIKKHFSNDVCDQILTDTFTICYDHKRKSPIAVYTEVTAKTVDLLNIDPRPPFFTDKRLDKKLQLILKIIIILVMIVVIWVHLMHLMIGLKKL